MRGMVASGTVAVLTALLLGGCARGESGGLVTRDRPSPSASSSGDTTPPAPPSSGTDLPTLRPPTGPPKSPTDQLPTDLIVGTVTAGGRGPCYGMETNDGKQYALYGTDGVLLSRGDTVRVKVKPLQLMIYCGPGEHVAIVKLEIVR